MRVSGSSREPRPPARMTPFIRSMTAADRAEADERHLRAYLGLFRIDAVAHGQVENPAAALGEDPEAAGVLQEDLRQLIVAGQIEDRERVRERHVERAVELLDAVV